MTTTPDLVPVALDAMGGDFAPAETVAGAVDAAKKGGVAVLLVGDPQAVGGELKKHEGAERLPLKVIPAEGFVAEGESPAAAFRSKPKASIFVATYLVKQGMAKAVVSMGSSGATVAAATVTLGTFPGIARPCLGGPIIGFAPNTLILDVGTNVDCRPVQLAHFAALGTAVARLLYGVDKPRVALLSVGAEEGKGNRLVKETTTLLKGTALNFVGNVEGNDLPLGKADVVIVDGFTGNVVMKLTESLGERIAQLVSEQLKDRVEAGALKAVTDEIYNQANPVEAYGGGPLFGVKGVAIVGHGKSKAHAVSRAIHTARTSATVGLIEGCARELERVQAVVGSESAPELPRG